MNPDDLHKSRMAMSGGQGFPSLSKRGALEVMEGVAGRLTAAGLANELLEARADVSVLLQTATRIQPLLPRDSLDAVELRQAINRCTGATP